MAQAGGCLVEADRPGLKAKLLPGIAVILGQEVGDGQTVQLTGLHLKHCEPILSTILKTHRPNTKVNTCHTRFQQEKGQEKTHMELLKVVLYSTFHATPSHNTYDNISDGSLRRDISALGLKN